MERGRKKSIPKRSEKVIKFLKVSFNELDDDKNTKRFRQRIGSGETNFGEFKGVFKELKKIKL
ncbi:MAG: hypothetical protein CL528_13420 [Aequorivita sp.]|jgi:hypothetical protein|nr:hypothetical protein [Aequorivita sp.]|tara:strand:+ start:19172 stop:19360 length:189 start_codon:yes stop_codon:yes gene_type:complete